MKPHLLLLLSVCLGGYVAMAQKVKRKAGVQSSTSIKDYESTKDVSAYQLSTIPISRSINAFTLLGKPRTTLSYQPELDVVTFVRRGSPTDPGGPTNTPGSKVYYDYSSDGGATWQVAKGKLHDNDDYAHLMNSNASYGGQFPQGLIWNPPSNTNPDKAFMTGFVPVLNNKNMNYGGLVYSSSKLSNPTPAVRNLLDDSLPKRQISHALATNSGGIIFHGEYELSNFGSGGLENTGRIIITKFSVDSANGAMTSEINYLNLPRDGSDKKAILSDIKLSFGPDGQHGFLTIIGWLPDLTLCPDSTFYPIIYKTTNGGNTWTGPLVPNLTDASNFLRLRENIRGDYFISPGSPPNKMVYSTTLQHGATVDRLNNLHVLVDVGFSGLRILPIINLPVEDPTLMVLRMHIIDLMLDASTSTFKYSVVGMPQSFRNNLNEFGGYWDHQLQASRNINGDKVFFTYFDTDTTKYRQQESALFDNKNNHPDLFLSGLEVGANGVIRSMRTRNVTHGTALDGKMFLANLSALVKETPQKISIPLTCALIGQTAIEPVEHVFLSGVDVSITVDSIFVYDPITYDTTLTSTVVLSSASSWQVFPIPTNDYIEIINPLKDWSEATFELIDVLGYRVQTGIIQFNDSKARMSLVGLKSGVYTLGLTNGFQRVCKKVVIK